MAKTPSSLPVSGTDIGQLTKRAWAYLRVSSEGQVQTGYSQKGLSIAAQRDAADDKGLQLNARVVRYWSDPGKSAYKDLHKRREFLAMLDELKQANHSAATRIDYLIIYATDRWARNVQDHFRTHQLVREAGSQLVSITEPLIGEDSPESFLFEGMQAVHNEYESRRTSRRVSSGLYRKAREGGSYGQAKLGYINDVDRLPDGRKVAAVKPDPERDHFVTLAFQLFASGEYSISSLCNELYDLGLRSRKGNKVGTSTMQSLLRNRYYLGEVVYKKGKPDEQIFPGRHDPLIDQDTFERVQALLDEKRVSGERAQKHQHYLKGSVYCGVCGNRLLYAFSRSQNGQRHAYFFCGRRTRGLTCSMRANIRPKLIEEAIERYYREHPVQLTAKDVAQRTRALEALVAASQQGLAEVKAAKTELITKLKSKQARLLRLHLEEGDEISPDAFRDERQRLSDEMQAAEKSLAATEQQLNLDGAMLRMALELAANVAAVYRKGPKTLRRGYNQAFFKKLKIRPEWDDDSGELSVRVVDAELTEPYAVLLADDFTDRAVTEAQRMHEARNAEGSPQGTAFLRSLFDLCADGGVGWCRTWCLGGGVLLPCRRRLRLAPCRGPAIHCPGIAAGRWGCVLGRSHGSLRGTPGRSRSIVAIRVLAGSRAGARASPRILDHLNRKFAQSPT